MKATVPLAVSPIPQSAEIDQSSDDSQDRIDLSDYMDESQHDEATEDDVLDLAMRVAIEERQQEFPLNQGLAASDEDDDDDEIIYRPPAGTIGDRR